MSVYVDPLMVYGGDAAPEPFRGRPSCHMYADTPEELNAMAIAIGMKAHWLQRSRGGVLHYDLVPARRFHAVSLGAIQHTRKEAVAKWRQLRDKSQVVIDETAAFDWSIGD